MKNILGIVVPVIPHIDRCNCHECYMRRLAEREELYETIIQTLNDPIYGTIITIIMILFTVHIIHYTLNIMKG